VAELAARDGDGVPGGGARRPRRESVQAGQYRQYLEDNHEAFYADDPPS